MTASSQAAASVEAVPSVELPRAGLGTTALYGIGDVGNSIRGVLNGLFIFFFYTSVMGLPGSLVGIASGGVLILDALVDPYIGHLSDQSQGGLGRRHGFMLVGAVAAGLTMWGLFSPPLGAPQQVVLLWFLAAMVLSRVAGGLFQIPYYALGAELSTDYQRRTLITGIRGFWALIGSLATASLTFVIFFPNVTTGVDPKLNYGGYPAMGLVFGAVICVTGLVATLTTLPRQRPTQGAALPSASPLVGVRAFWQAARVAFGRQSFRALFLSFAVIYLGTVVNSSLSLHFFTYYARIIDSRDLGLVRGSFYVSAMVGIPLWLALSRVLQKHQSYLIGTFATLATMVLGFVLVGEGRPLGTGVAWPLIVGQAIAGLAASVFWIIPPSMLADVSDEDALATGTYRRGVFFGLLSLGQKLLTGLSLLLSGLLIDGFAGLVPGQAEQSALTVSRIGILFCLLPAALLAVGALLITRYSLDRARMVELRRQLAAEHAEGLRSDGGGANMPGLVGPRA